VESDSDYDFQDNEIIEGDFVVVKFVSGKSRVEHHIARVDVVDGEECEGVFLQRQGSLQQVTPTFVLNEKDDASFPKTDIILKLPVPKMVGGTARLAGKFKFNCDFTQWEFHSTLH
jgi:hypothetical protein